MQENDDALAPKGTPKPHQIEPPKKTWWFQRGEEHIPVSEIEAWHILRGKNAYHRNLKLVGVSDGVMFSKAVKESHDAFRSTGDIVKSQEILRAAYESEYQSGLGRIESPRNQEVTNLSDAK